MKSSRSPAKVSEHRKGLNMSELFDDISRIVGSPIPRRRALKAVGGALMGAVFGASLYRKVSSAQTTSSCCQGDGGSCVSQDGTMFCDPRDPWFQEKCEAAGFEWRPGHTCCPDFHTCPPEAAVCCGATCCDDNSFCLNGACCPMNRVCQNFTFCCPSNTVCVNNVCCPTERVCTNPTTNQTICCSSGRCCGGTKCCPSGVCTSDGLNCGGGGFGGGPIVISPSR